MSKAISILLLQGDAEAQLLADADAVLQDMVPHREVHLVRAWATRPDWLDPDAPPPPRSLVEAGVLPEQDARRLLEQDHSLVVLALLPALAMPALRHRDGGVFLAHRGLRAEWSEETERAVDAACAEEEQVSPLEAARALEPVVERLLLRGAAVAVCTGFRHVREPRELRAGAQNASLRERIRAMNLEIARLSQRTGCFVLDLDRPLAQEGGAALDADCFGGGARAAEIALDEFAALVLDSVPDEALAEDA